MRISQINYLPLATELFELLFGLLVIVAVVVVLLRFLGMLRQAYQNLGVGPYAAILLLACSLIGSYLDIPLAKIPAAHVTSGRVIKLLGVQFGPTDAVGPGTVLAINIGGAVIPILMSIYLLIRRGLWIKAAVATTAVALLMHWLATPVTRSGITVPMFLPSVAAAIIALLLSRREAAQLAYIGGGVGTLIGADLTNLDKVAGVGVSMASIGGAGTFDAVFLTGVMGVLIASIDVRPRAARPAKP